MAEGNILLSVVIPARNEEKHIGLVLEAVNKYLESAEYRSEVIVVIDGASDNTAGVVEEYAKRMPRVRAINNKEDHGNGYVARQGILEASGELRLYMGADNETPIEEIEKLLNFIKNPRSHEDEQHAYDVVIGSTAPSDIGTDKSKLNVGSLSRKMTDLLIQIMVLPGIHDARRGFKLFTAQAADDIFSHLTIDGRIFDIEVLAVARKFNYRIKEVPIRQTHNDTGHVGASEYTNTLIDLVKIRIGLWSGKYKKL